MGFKSVNEMESFSFEDCVINRWEMVGEDLHVEVEALIVKANNSQNSNYTDSYAATTNIRLYQARILSCYQEGVRYYDANDVLKSEIPDRELTRVQWQDLLDNCAGKYLYCMEKIAQNEGTYEYSVGLENNEDNDYGSTVLDSYRVQIQFEKAVFEWEHYLNRVQK